MFTRPSFLLFWTLVSAWVLCPGRRTVTRMIGVADPMEAHAHDAYHRFLRVGVWTMVDLWRTLVGLLVTTLAPAGVVLVDLDDTLFHKAGRKIEGAGTFRDPIRSTARNAVYALGLNVVVLTVRLIPPWGGEPLGLPVNVRLYRKGGPSHLALGAAMLQELATWLPDRDFALTCDGAYAALAGMALPRTRLTSRMRRDAALYAPPPPRKRGQRGRPRKRGRRLPSPAQLAHRARRGWVSTSIDVRGKPVERLLLAVLSFWIYAAVWLWYLKVYGTKPSWPTWPWYPKKCTPSFADALAALRRTLWHQRISANPSSEPLSSKITAGLIEILARAA